MPRFLNRRRRAFAVVMGVFLVSVPAFVGDALAGTGKWIVDESNRCGTSNPFLVPGERIRWYGPCANGRLHGRGTLIWYRGTAETERNEGFFANGEFHGDVLTTFPDGQKVFGQYVAGVRHGEFMIIRVDGQPVRADYDNGTLKSQTEMTGAEVASFKQRRLNRLAATKVPPPAPVAAVAQTTAPTPVSRPAAIPPPQPVVEAPPPPPPPAPARDTAAADEKESSGWGFGKVLGYMNPLNWELNPLNWGVADKVTGLFRSPPPPMKAATAPSDAKSAAAPQPSPRPQSQQQAQPRPAPQPPAPRTVAPQVARAQPPAAPARSAKPSLPVATSPSYVNTAPPGFSSAKNLYDMSVFMNEPHPFADTPGAKAQIPIVDGVSRYVSGVFRSTNTPARAPAVNSTVTLANGWHGAPPSPYDGYTPAAVALPGPTTIPTPAAADSIFNRAYQLERTGDFSRAEVLYEQVVMQYPSAPTARLANDRLNAIRTAATQSFARAGLPPAPEIKPATNYMAIREGDRVIAVNSPIPDQRSRGRANSVAGFSQVHTSNYINERVCSRPELYDGGAVWCGLVRADEGTHFMVEVRDVQLGTFGMVGISRSTCTGGAFLNWFSRGTTIRVPRNCFAIDG